MLHALGRAVTAYLNKPVERLSPSGDDSHAALFCYVFYGVLPMWSLAGFYDWYCHRRSKIERNAGTAESLMHNAMFVEMGIPIVTVSLCEVTSGTVALMLGTLALHTATAYWDVSYALPRRHVSADEQHAHSFLEVLPMAAFMLVTSLAWPQTKALLSGSNERDMGIRLRKTRLSLAHLAFLGVMAVGLGAIPYAEEFVRCVRANSR